MLAAKKKTIAAFLGFLDFREFDSPWAFVKNQKPMKLKSTLRSFLALAGSSLIAMSSAHAATIANWKEMNPNAAVPTNSGMNTNSPTIGNGTANNADDAWVAGRFGTVASPESVTLAVGETLTVSGSVTFTGGDTLASQFRFGVFDGGADFAADNTTWANGGWLYVAPGTAPVGLLQAATNNLFLTNNTSTSDVFKLTPSTDTNSGAFNGNSTTPYNWSFTITRDSLTTVDLSALLTGGSSPVNFASSVNNQTTSLFTYSTVGLLFGNGLNLDQGALSNVQYNVIPEPRTALLGGLGMLVLLRRRRCA